MQLTRITATIGAFALGGLLVASTTSAGASASVDRQRPAHPRSTVHHRLAPTPVPANLRMGKHCISAHMSM